MAYNHKIVVNRKSKQQATRAVRDKEFDLDETQDSRIILNQNIVIHQKISIFHIQQNISEHIQREKKKLIQFHYETTGRRNPK